MSMEGIATTVNFPNVNPRKVPKRYEETRPVLIQGCAHSQIIGLGHELHKKEMEKAEQEKLQAIQLAEKAVLAEAEIIKEQALAKVKEETAIEQERAIKKLKKQHEKALLEEALKVEMAMQKLAIEQVKQERKECEKRLKQALKETEDSCQKEKVAAVAIAVGEERKNASDEAENVAKANKDRFDTAMKKAEEEKMQALKDLRDGKDIEKAVAVQEAEMRERRIAKEKINALTRQFETIVANLRKELEEKIELICRLEAEKLQHNTQKTNVENCLMDTRNDFQDFIDNLPPFDKMQADFMMPQVYLDELEQKGYNIKPLRPVVKKTKQLKQKEVK